jgi:hypothetical protein
LIASVCQPSPALTRAARTLHNPLQRTNKPLVAAAEPAASAPWAAPPGAGPLEGLHQPWATSRRLTFGDVATNPLQASPLQSAASGHARRAVSVARPSALAPAAPAARSGAPQRADAAAAAGLKRSPGGTLRMPDAVPKRTSRAEATAPRAGSQAADSAFGALAGKRGRVRNLEGGSNEPTSPTGRPSKSVPPLSFGMASSFGKGPSRRPRVASPSGGSALSGGAAPAARSSARDGSAAWASPGSGEAQSRRSTLGGSVSQALNTSWPAPADGSASARRAAITGQSSAARQEDRPWRDASVPGSAQPDVASVVASGRMERQRAGRRMTLADALVSARGVFRCFWLVWRVTARFCSAHKVQVLITTVVLAPSRQVLTYTWRHAGPSAPRPAANPTFSATGYTSTARATAAPVRAVEAAPNVRAGSSNAFRTSSDWQTRVAAFRGGANDNLQRSAADKAPPSVSESAGAWTHRDAGGGATARDAASGQWRQPSAYLVSSLPRQSATSDAHHHDENAHPVLAQTEPRRGGDVLSETVRTFITWSCLPSAHVYAC